MTKRLATALVALTGALGLLAVALYASFAQHNLGTASKVASKPVPVRAASASCPADPALKARLEEAAIGEVAGFEAFAEGIDLTALAFKDKDGADRTIADFSGKTVLMNLWATWCAPCRAEMPALQEVHEKRGSEAFEVVAVSIDAGAPKKAEDFYVETGLTTLPFYHDGSYKLFTAMKKDGLAPGLPTTVLIDEKGCARGVLKAPAEWASPDAFALVDAALGN